MAKIKKQESIIKKWSDGPFGCFILPLLFILCMGFFIVVGKCNYEIREFTGANDEPQKRKHYVDYSDYDSIRPYDDD